MKVLQVSPTYSPYLDGGAEHVKNICERLAKKYDVTVYTCDFSGDLPKEEVINGVKVKRFKCLSFMNAGHLSPGMLREIKKHRFDVVHAHNYHALPFYLAKFAPGSRFVVSTLYHGHAHTVFLDFFFKLYKILGRQVLKKADCIISNSNTEKAALVRDFPQIAGKITIVPPGSDSQNDLRTEGIEKKPHSILFVGRLEEYKGVQDIIQVLPLLDRDFRLSVVGKGVFKDKLVALVDKLGLQERVSFYQDLARPELMKMYSEAGLFVLLSKFESYSIVVAEALSCGTPCVVANTSSLRDWIDQEKCFGIDYPVNRERLASLIKNVSGKRIDKVEIWNWEEAVNEIIKIYENKKI